MSLPGSIITDARAAWKLLHGVICVYKPVASSSRGMQEELRAKVAEGLNAMKVREPETIVELKRIESTIGAGAEKKSPITSVESGSDLDKLFSHEVVGELEDGPDRIQVVKRLNYADHPLVTGPRYAHEDIKLWDISRLGPNTSGITGLNRGIPLVQRLERMKWLKTYVISGQFGIATSTGYYTGRIVDKSTYHKLRKSMLDRFLASAQASHQKTMFEACGVSLQSERAYEIACQGLPRPENQSTPLIYSLKCTKFDPPNFDIEMAVVNETEDFLMTLIHDFGIRLHTAAVTTKIRCVKYGPFDLDLTLLMKHCTAENFINNAIRVKEILRTVDLQVRDPLVTNQSSDRVKNLSRTTNEGRKEVEYV